MGKPGSRTKEESSADRKFEKKLQFYAKVRDTVTALGAQKAITKKKKLRSRQKKLKAYDLSSLSEVLPIIEAPREKAPVVFKLKSKNRKDLLLKEGNTLKTVINDPNFQSDPVNAVYQHLLKTQPAAEEKQKPKHGKGRKKAKGNNRKPLTGSQPMEV